MARQPISKGSGGHSISQALGIPAIQQIWSNPNLNPLQKLAQTAGVVVNDAGKVTTAAGMMFGGPEIGGADAAITGGADLIEGGMQFIEDDSEYAYQFTQTVWNHTIDIRPRTITQDGIVQFFQGELLRPYINSPGVQSLINLIMEGDSIPDPRGAVNAFRWVEPGFFNGSEGNWELVVDTTTNTVLHFMFGR